MHRFARSVFSAAVLALGLSMGLWGCNEEVSRSLIASKDLGGVAFRLSQADSAVFATVADSVRIQASREGYPVHSVSGSLRGTTSLPDLEPGTWRLEIALYDSLHALRWYGDTSVEVRAGAATDAVVRLFPAKGSVNVRIVLDSSSRVVWTDTLPVGSANWGNQATWRAPKVWRTTEGIFLERPPFQCGMLPKVRLASKYMTCPPDVYCGTVLPIVDSSGLVLELDDQSAVTSCVAVKYGADQVVRHFVPWTRRGNVTLHMSTESVVLQDPRNSEQEPIDSAFAKYDYSISGFTPIVRDFTLEPSGRATFLYAKRYATSTDTAPVIRVSALHPDSLAIALSILQSAAVRHPVALGSGGAVVDPNGLEIGCPMDGPFYGRKVRYANGAAANLSWSYSNYCGPLPSGWKDLNRVDAMLEALFAE